MDKRFKEEVLMHLSRVYDVIESMPKSYLFSLCVSNRSVLERYGLRSGYHYLERKIKEHGKKLNESWVFDLKETVKKKHDPSLRNRYLWDPYDKKSRLKFLDDIIDEFKNESKK